MQAEALPGCAASTSATVAFAPASSRSITSTDAPSRVKRRVVARPKPEPAPVIMATLPSSLPMVYLPFLLSCGEYSRTPHGIARVWPQPGKEPLVMVDRAVLVAVQHQSTVLAAIGPLVERQGLRVPTPTA